MYLEAQRAPPDCIPFRQDIFSFFHGGFVLCSGALSALEVETELELQLLVRRTVIHPSELLLL